ncbi:headcase protein family like domain-containing protein [Ditylenchus destructor]|uniref:Headcase protein family like domain-containing protein n=1 Tax=Ditylenchus destructor TaxID=166010 RepID=A0AAD4QZJ9_9BILA|nr:headcase protein family like domain-containing protein [Ditylenchus destructor]
MGKDKQKKLSAAFIAKKKKVHQQQQFERQKSTNANGYVGCPVPHIDCCLPDSPLPESLEDGVKMTCGNASCPCDGDLVHRECFDRLQGKLVEYMASIGRGRHWPEKNCQANMWQKKGLPLIFDFLDCHCGRGKIVFVPEVKMPLTTQPMPKTKKKKSRKELPAVNLGSKDGHAATRAIKMSRKEYPAIEVVERFKTESVYEDESDPDDYVERTTIQEPVHLLPSAFPALSEMPATNEECVWKMQGKTFSEALKQPAQQKVNPLPYDLPLQTPRAIISPSCTTISEHPEEEFEEWTPWESKSIVNLENILSKAMPPQHVEVDYSWPKMPELEDNDSSSHQVMEFTKHTAFLSCKYRGFRVLLDVMNDRPNRIKECFQSKPFTADDPDNMWQLNMFPYGFEEFGVRSNIGFKVGRLEYERSDDVFGAKVDLNVIMADETRFQVHATQNPEGAHVFAVDRDVVPLLLQPDGSFYVKCKVEYLRVSYS